MSELTENELNILNKEVERSGLTYTELQQELLDHLCCDIEVKMDDGIAFVRALEEVKKEMGQDCIRQIQEDTLLLINQKYRMMKKFMYILGTIAPSLVIIGTFFKTQHWPGANILLVLGLFLLGAVYLPVFISVKIRGTRKEGKPVNKAMYIIGMISGIIFIIGAMFKIMHWLGASIMISLTGLVTVVVFIPLLVINAIRDKENQVHNFTVLIFVLSFIAIIFMTLSLSVSKGVMNSFDLAANNNTRTFEVLQKNNSLLANKIVSINQSMSGSISELTEITDELNAYIDETIETLVKATHDNNTEAIDSDGNIDFDLVLEKDDTNTPAYIMLGIDYDIARGEVVKRMMEELKAFVSGLENEQISLMAEKLLDTSTHEEKYAPSWVSHKFEHLPMMSVLVQLTNIQVNSQIIEAEVLRSFMEEAINSLDD